jgi:hypothetical protein
MPLHAEHFKVFEKKDWSVQDILLNLSFQEMYLLKKMG